MNKILDFLIILLIVSCTTNSNKVVRQEIIIAGKVKNHNSDNLKVQLGINRIGLGQEQLSTTLDKNGYFRSTFKSKISTDLWIRYKTNFLVLVHPGDSIFVEFDGSKVERKDLLKSIKFRGDGSEQNKSVAEFQRMYFSSNSYTDRDTKEKAIKEYDEVRYKIFRDSIRNEDEKLLIKFEKKYKPSNETKNWAKIFLDVEYLRDLLTYPDFHKMSNNLKNSDWNVPITYYDFLKNHFSLSNSILINGYALSVFVNLYPFYILERIKDENKISFSSPDIFKRNPEKLDSLRFFGVIKFTDDTLLRQMVLTEILRQNLEQSSIKMFENNENLINDQIKELYLREPLFNLYHETRMRLDNPKLASDAILKKFHGSSLKSNIGNIISRNKGKVIYMDCWATWCGPCLAEMPNSKKLMEEYKPNDVAFIFVCLDSEEKTGNQF